MDYIGISEQRIQKQQKLKSNTKKKTTTWLLNPTVRYKSSLLEPILQLLSWGVLIFCYSLT